MGKVDAIKVAKWLYQTLEMRFTRDWIDLPENVRTDWVVTANELIKFLKTSESRE
jgi:hypothetical protein